ncbi:MAG: ArsR family regulatory protein [uncultured bacterium (gcode 4)]|uniref:ArsR family regulatory protein n=1 Tax=uncultured bacterium (gcode 4) TaxID=1234023 RepID=K2FVW6_9BACT|nr:MAG: ArsR family regulatory protein [uncultured bacterium (gcode 4)]
MARKKTELVCLYWDDVNEFIKTLTSISQINRIQIICLLRQNKTMPVNDIVEKLKLRQNLVSHHLWELKKVGILEAKRAWKQIFYSINEEFYKKFVDWMDEFFKWEIK